MSNKETLPHIVRNDLAQQIADHIQLEFERLAKFKNDQGALARAVLRLKKAGAPFDEIEVVSRPLLDAFSRAFASDTGEAEIHVPKYSRSA